ncbi:PLASMODESMATA CALLOSE-BINDING PROTEIN 5-like [Salvia splendens]|uniref:PLASMODESMATA CALLOSE-BINDING PROTEIN 5-like n=1 Tax=Salvia splendens TaxID=180675 RepID=UPI001C2538D0|nr:PLASMODESMATA CALLOSE-BINDING PROTEIN 5-like [Salvia splendens]
MDSGVDIFFALFSLISAAAAAAQGGGGGAARQLWCVAKNNAEDAALQSALDWTCGPGGADCGPIQNGGPCYDAADLQKTASFAFNDYFLKHGPSEETCNFANTAAITDLNPSHGSCKFPSSLTAGNGNFSGAAGVDSGGVDPSSSSSIARLRSLVNFMLLAIPLVV